MAQRRQVPKTGKRKLYSPPGFEGNNGSDTIHGKLKIN
jgi:hypothetical protein